MSHPGVGPPRDGPSAGRDPPLLGAHHGRAGGRPRPRGLLPFLRLPQRLALASTCLALPTQKVTEWKWRNRPLSGCEERRGEAERRGVPWPPPWSPVSTPAPRSPALHPRPTPPAHGFGLRRAANQVCCVELELLGGGGWEAPSGGLTHFSRGRQPYAAATRISAGSREELPDRVERLAGI